MGLQGATALLWRGGAYVSARPPRLRCCGAPCPKNNLWKPAKGRLLRSAARATSTLHRYPSCHNRRAARLGARLGVAGHDIPAVGGRAGVPRAFRANVGRRSLVLEPRALGLTLLRAAVCQHCLPGECTLSGARGSVLVEDGHSDPSKRTHNSLLIPDKRKAADCKPLLHALQMNRPRVKVP